jgi:hypothetical protein
MPSPSKSATAALVATDPPLLKSRLDRTSKGFAVQFELEQLSHATQTFPQAPQFCRSALVKAQNGESIEPHWLKPD